jgi:hypothetical protein
LRLLRRHLLALAFEPDPAPLSLRETAALLLFHLIALGLVSRLAHWPSLASPIFVGIIALLQKLRRPVRLEALAPLGLLYGVAILRLAIAAAFRLGGQTAGELAVPDPWGTWLSYTAAASLALIWLIAIELAQRVRPARLGPAVGLGLGAGALGWAAWNYFQMAPSGVTGSDPYAYVQMALDLVQRGTLLHHFSLAQIAFEHHLPVYPTVAVGYHTPASPDGLSPSVWPPGFSIVLAAVYRLIGEHGLYLANPCLGVLAIALTFALTADILRPHPLRPHPQRWLAAGLASAWLSTSVEQAIRLAVPLADVAAQVFTLGALWLAWRASNQTNLKLRTAGLWLTAGLLFGLAYFTRYTQVLAGLAFLYLALAGGEARFNKGLAVGAFGLGAATLALMSFVYQTVAFGHPLATGSGELGHFSLAAIPAVLARVGGDMFSPFEWGWALLFILAGGVSLWRNRRRAAWALVLGFVPPLVFHLPYAFLKLRDLLWLFPAWALLAGCGGVEIWAWLRQRRAVIRALGFFLALALLTWRWSLTLPLTQGFFTFGSLTAEQRQTISQLSDRTPPDAIIAASLNSGAVELYAHRAVVRPGALLQPNLAWTTDEWLRFVEAIRAENRPLYLLADSVEMEAPLKAVQARYPVIEIAPPLYLPYYYVGGGSDNQLVALYQIGH